MNEDNTLLFALETEKTLIRPDVPTQRVMALSLRAMRTASANRMPLNLALVLDRSGSMSGEKIAYVKQAASHVLDLLGDQDGAVVVTYDDEIALLAPLSPVTPANRAELKRRISAVRPGGSTNLSGGWLTGCEALAHTADAKKISRTLLLTDGLANAGITDPEQISSHAKELFRRGVSTSTFGVGLGFNEHLLEAMSNQGGGNFYYIETPGDIPALFQQEFKELAAVTASQVVVELEVPAGVSLEVLGGWTLELAPGRAKLTPGNLFAGQNLEIFLKALTPPGNTGESLIIRATLTSLDEHGQPLEARAEICFQYDSQANVQAAPVNAMLLERFAAVDMAETANNALKLERQGRHEAASSMMMDGLIACRAYAPSAVTRQYSDMAEEMSRGMNETSLKEAHYSAYRSRRMRPQEQDDPDTI